jgi:hypothetical protein
MARPGRIQAQSANAKCVAALAAVKGKRVAVKSIKLGQVWRQEATGQDHLVTKVYSEVFTQYAVLRRADVNAPSAPAVKVKVTKSPDGVSLPGFSFTQEGAF